MEFSIKTGNINTEKLKAFLESFKPSEDIEELLQKKYSAIENSFLVVSVWENDQLVGLCRVISDGNYFGRIQELLVHPQLKENRDLITEMLETVFESCPNLKSFHLNPGVSEKKHIYYFKHFAQTPRLRKIYWSIHEDEF